MMEEVGSHDDDEHICAAAEGGHADGVISDALQEAARTNVPESKYKDAVISDYFRTNYRASAACLLVSLSV